MNRRHHDHRIQHVEGIMHDRERRDTPQRRKGVKRLTSECIDQRKPHPDGRRNGQSERDAFAACVVLAHPRDARAVRSRWSMRVHRAHRDSSSTSQESVRLRSIMALLYTTMDIARRVMTTMNHLYRASIRLSHQYEESRATIGSRGNTLAVLALP